MSEKDTIYEAKIKQNGIFDFGGLYKFAFQWLDEEGYDINEKQYAEKIKGDLKEITIIWEAERKISDYFKFQLKLTWYIPDLAKIEVQKDGKKESMNKGTPEIKFKAVMIKDYEGRWENSSFLKFLRGVYDRYIIRGRIEEYEGKIVGELTKLISEIKAFLSIENR